MCDVVGVVLTSDVRVRVALAQEVACGVTGNQKVASSIPGLS